MKHILASICLAGLFLNLAQTAWSQPKTEILGSGHELTGVRVGGAKSDVLLIQDGLKIYCLRQGKDAPAILNTVQLPPQSYVWDFVDAAPGTAELGEVLVQTSTGVYAANVSADHSRTPFTKLSEAGDLFRGNLSTPPIGKQFAWRVGENTYWALPTLTGIQTFQRDGTGKVSDFGVHAARLTSTQTLGSGMGYRLKARVTVPFFDLDTDAQGQSSLLFRQDAHYSARPFAAGSFSTWGKAPASEDNLVVEFEHRVPPLFVDYDGDNQKDLLHIDPGSGTTLLYSSTNRELGKAAEPDHVFRITGHLLWRWLVDGDGDGKKDLFLLELAQLSKIAQVKVMQNRSLPVVLSMRKQLSGGRFQASANWSDRFELPCEISLTRNVKRVRFRTPFQLFSNPNGAIQLLGPTEEGKVAVYRRADDAWEPVSTHPDLYVDEGFLVEPFDARVWQTTSSLRQFVTLTRNPTAEKDRVILLPIGQDK